MKVMGDTKKARHIQTTSRGEKNQVDMMLHIDVTRREDDGGMERCEKR